jgi:hypothetical protein
VVQSLRLMCCRTVAVSKSCAFLPRESEKDWMSLPYPMPIEIYNSAYRCKSKRYEYQ